MKKFFDKKRKNKGFSLVELIVVVAIMAVLMAVLVPTLVSNVEKSRQQKDKTAIAELRHAIVNALADEACLDASVSGGSPCVNDGEIMIAGLFGTANADGDKEAKANAAIAAKVAEIIGSDRITLTSKYNNENTVITLREFDGHAGVVVLEVRIGDSGNELDFYIDSVGQHTGTVPAADDEE